MSENSSVGLEMALHIAALGGRVIPAYIDRHCDKRPLVREWQNAGTKEVAQIEQWYRDKQWANVGVLGGRMSFAIFDCDGPEAVAGFRSICERVSGIDWEQVLLYTTPGRADADGNGGLHAMWLCPEWLWSVGKAEIRREGWRGGIEYRGNGTWTLLPCKRPDGEYRIINAPEKIGELPRELWDAFIAEAQIDDGMGSGGLSDLKEVSPAEIRAFVEQNGLIGDGRKNILAGLAWYLAIRGTSESEYWEALQWFAVDCCSPVLEESVVRRKGEYTLERVARIKAKQQAETARFSSMMNRFV